MVELNELLTPYQEEKLATVLKAIMDSGYGEITIRVVKGIPRFIAVSTEKVFMPAHIDDIAE